MSGDTPISEAPTLVAERREPAGDRVEGRRRPFIFRLGFGLIKAYLVIGSIFGLIRFGSYALHAAMSVPPREELVAGLFDAAIQGLIRTLDWAPSFVTRVLMQHDHIVLWLLY